MSPFLIICAHTIFIYVITDCQGQSFQFERCEVTKVASGNCEVCLYHFHPCSYILSRRQLYQICVFTVINGRVQISTYPEHLVAITRRILRILFRRQTLNHRWRCVGDMHLADTALALLFILHSSSKARPQFCNPVNICIIQHKLQRKVILFLKNPIPEGL